MRQRGLRIVLCLLAISALAWLGRAGQQKTAPRWERIAPGVLRTPGPVAGYALLAGDRALLIDAPQSAAGLAEHGVRTIEGVLLTHYHRDVCAAVADFLERCPVKAPLKADEWLRPESVQKYWQTSLPLRSSRTAYLVHPTGFPGVQYTLADGQFLDWQGWKIRVADTPGHALAHVAFAAQKEGGPRYVFCGGAFAAPGKLWAPYTTDWDHWTDAGLKPTAASLRKLIELRPDVLCPSRGPLVKEGIEASLKLTLDHILEVGFLKSFERFTKERVGNAPSYRFLAKEQATSNGSLPWSRVSEHLWLTGNTYVLVSKDNACLMFDPWGKRSADQFAKLRAEQKLGPLEVVMFSHAHYDHYDGIYELPGRGSFEIWALDAVAGPIAEPMRLRAPFLDARPVKFDRTPRDGEALSWREYRFRFHFLPGQSEFSMGVETTLDGKRCLFTADNFFHQDMFSGSGGWMGLNRSFPPRYAASARKVLDLAPEWVLAEHGGPFEFSAEDFRRRADWGEAAGKAADALSPSGQHLHDWNPHRLHVEPLVQKARAGAEVKGTLVFANALPRERKVTVELQGRGLIRDQTWEMQATANGTTRREIALALAAGTPAGRHVFALRITDGAGLDASDAFLVADVER
jgi:glyoxylase-like metal-dependent hydrolase (beta-lactamase superfamily II)